MSSLSFTYIVIFNDYEEEKSVVGAVDFLPTDAYYRGYWRDYSNVECGIDLLSTEKAKYLTKERAYLDTADLAVKHLTNIHLYEPLMVMNQESFGETDSRTSIISLADRRILRGVQISPDSPMSKLSRHRSILPHVDNLDSFHVFEQIAFRRVTRRLSTSFLENISLSYPRYERLFPWVNEKIYFLNTNPDNTISVRPDYSESDISVFRRALRELDSQNILASRENRKYTKEKSDRKRHLLLNPTGEPMYQPEFFKSFGDIWTDRGVGVYSLQYEMELVKTRIDFIYEYRLLEKVASRIFPLEELLTEPIKQLQREIDKLKKSSGYTALKQKNLDGSPMSREEMNSFVNFSKQIKILENRLQKLSLPLDIFKKNKSLVEDKFDSSNEYYRKLDRARLQSWEHHRHELNEREKSYFDMTVKEVEALKKVPREIDKSNAQKIAALTIKENKISLEKLFQWTEELLDNEEIFSDLDEIQDVYGPLVQKIKKLLTDLKKEDEQPMPMRAFGVPQLFAEDPFESQEEQDRFLEKIKGIVDDELKNYEESIKPVPETDTTLDKLTDEFDENAANYWLTSNQPDGSVDLEETSPDETDNPYTDPQPEFSDLTKGTTDQVGGRRRYVTNILNVYNKYGIVYNL